ncbi:MAG: VOC family protein [Ruminococcaceae bacterium]|nr:VOC family protein [Oscillospiraceae bacterium]
MSEKKKINGFHHIALKCRGKEEFDKTVEFYRDILAVPVARTWGEGDSSGIMLDTGTGIFEITASGNDRLGQGALRHLALDVDDTDAWVEAVRKAGYEITMEPTDICIKSDPPYPARIAFCIGPVGEEIEFFCVK